MGVATLAYLWFNRQDEVEGTSLLYPTVALPSILAALVAFNVVMGPASALVMEREDGTLLRHRALPHGRSEEHTSELQSRQYIVCRLLLEKKKTPSGRDGNSSLRRLAPCSVRPRRRSSRRRASSPSSGLHSRSCCLCSVLLTQRRRSPRQP